MFEMYDEPDLKVIVYTPLKEGETAAKIRQLLGDHSKLSGGCHALRHIHPSTRS